MSRAPSSFAALAALLTPGFVHAQTVPVGYLDQAGCGGIAGWAQDPDVPDAVIDVHLYFGGPAGDPAAHGVALRADLHRDDLCTAIRSCVHGFHVPLPLGYYDGRDRAVYAYAIDSAGGQNPLLGNAPRTARCDAASLPPIPAGAVRRHVGSPEILAAWRMSGVDVAARPEAALGDLADGAPLPAAPLLVRMDGDPRVFVRDGEVLRHVLDGQAMAAWRFDYGAIRVIPPAEGAALLVGAPWPRAPLFARGSGPRVYAIDAPPPLWASLLMGELPTELAPGATADVTFTLHNFGSLTWTRAVELAPTPRDVASPLCHPSWPSCTRAAAVIGEVPSGGQTTLTVRVAAPLAEGPLTACFGLVRGAQWFSDPGQLGPPDDAVCRSLRVRAGAVVAPDAGEVAGADVGVVIGPDAGDAGAPGGIPTFTPSGCSTTPAGPDALLLLLVLQLVVFLKRGQTERTATPGAPTRS